MYSNYRLYIDMREINFIKTKRKKKSPMRNKTYKIYKTNTNASSTCVYNENDFHSDNGMLTMIWGPSMWHFLHTMSFNYPVHPLPKEKIAYRDFVIHLQYVLPCGKCRKNFVKNLKKMPLQMHHMNSRDTFSRYIYELHELINKMLNKKSNLTYEEVRERYEHFRARCALPYSEIEKQLKKQLGEKSKEVGCVEPLYGEKSKCILHIVPQSTEGETLQIDEKCIKKKLSV